MSIEIPPQDRTSIPITGVPGGGSGFSVPLIRQTQTEWCWAACAEMVLHRYGLTGVGQCDLANWLFTQTSCCAAPGSSLCNCPCLLDDDVSEVYEEWEIGSTRVEAQVPFDTIENEIAAHRPVEVALQWGFVAHLVLIVDTKLIIGEPWVTVFDPFYGRVAATYDEVVNAYGRGSWFWTWIGIHP